MTSPKIGVVGGGQLARMMSPAAIELGIALRCLAESEDACAVTAIPDTEVGDYRDWETLRRFADTVDVLTFDHEHVPQEFLERLVASGHAVRPGPHALQYAQDKLLMRQKIDELGIPNPTWAKVQDEGELLSFAEEHSWPVILKTPRGGYDGKGVALVRSAEDLKRYQDWWNGTPLLVEEYVPFESELSALLARTPSGEILTWPVVHSVQVDGVCDEVFAPAPELDADLEQKITQAARLIASELDVSGVLAVELFKTPPEDPRGFLINELAMRPHNTGHWTQDGSVTSQFEQHLRAVLDMPLGSSELTRPGTMMKNILGGTNPDLTGVMSPAMSLDSGAKIHLYDKSVRPGRKVGHVNRNVLAPSEFSPTAAKVRKIVDVFREGVSK